MYKTCTPAVKFMNENIWTAETYSFVHNRKLFWTLQKHFNVLLCNIIVNSNLYWRNSQGENFIIFPQILLYYDHNDF